MNNFFTSKKFIVLIIVLFAVAAILFGVLFKIKIQQVNKLPDLLPVGIVLEKEVQILQKYNNEDSTKNEQYSTISYVSKNAPQKNLNLFTNYLRNSGWSVLITGDNRYLEQINGKIVTTTFIKDLDRVDLVFSINTTNQSIVDITMTHYAKANKK